MEHVLKWLPTYQGAILGLSATAGVGKDPSETERNMGDLCGTFLMLFVSYAILNNRCPWRAQDMRRTFNNFEPALKFSDRYTAISIRWSA